MLESYRGSNKKHKININNIEGQNSYKELIKKNKKVIKRKRIDGNKTMKVTNDIEVKEEKKKNFH